MKIPKNKTLLQHTFIVCCYLLFIAVSINYHIIQSAKQYIKNADDACLTGADCILVLGALVWKNGRPSHILEDRVITGIDLYRGCPKSMQVW